MTALLLIAAQAIPWYLFPGSKAGVNVPAKTQEDTVKVAAAPVVPEVIAPRDSVAAPKDTFRLDIPETVRISVLLPFRTASGYDEGTVDFYSGALMAARELGEEGIKIEINAYDSSSGAIPEECFGGDIILGPVGEKEISAAAKSLPDGKWLVSPLEPRACALCDSLRVIQLPTSVSAQYLDLACWAGEEISPNDRIFILTDPEERNQNITTVTSKLESLGLEYTLKKDISEYNDPETAERLREGTGTFRFILVSDSEPYIGECIRKVRVMSMLKFNVAMYALSKVRSIETINVEHLHNCSTRISSTYYVDYSSPEARQFVYSYRALFNGEPNSFAFDGYDAVRHLVSACRKYGRMWPLKIGEFKSRGLQMNFDFEKKGKEGAVNTATVRFIYNPDYSVLKLK